MILNPRILPASPAVFCAPRSATKPLSRTGGSPSAYELDSCPLIFLKNLKSEWGMMCYFLLIILLGSTCNRGPLGISLKRTWFADRLVSTPALLIWITSQSLSPDLLWAPITAGRKKWRSGAFLLDRWGASRYSIQGAFSLEKSVYKKWGQVHWGGSYNVIHTHGVHWIGKLLIQYNTNRH